MPDKVLQIDKVIGLKEIDIPALQTLFGKNVFKQDKPRNIFHLIIEIIREPMFILLVTACILYFILGKINEGWMMIAAMLFVAAISLYEEIKSTNALDALKEFSEPKVIVLRDGKQKPIASSELVPGDIMLLEEGNKISADGKIIHRNDLSVNESVITGESMPVYKDETSAYNIIYQGTIINSGKGYAQVTEIGNRTVLGKLGKSINGYTENKTLLQKQISNFVYRLDFFGLSAFVIIWIVNFLKSGDLTLSLLFALTLVMASIPEEIPVTFSTFMALGAYQMSKKGIISRQPQTIENLGAVSIICLDKTGTITENRMQVKIIYDYESDNYIEVENNIQLPHDSVLTFGALASEINPFDPMEKAIWKSYIQHTDGKVQDNIKMVYEYPLEGRPPMMTHVYELNNFKKVAAKGAAERILKVCRLDDLNANKIRKFITELSTKGYRVIGVASAIHFEDTLPLVQDDFKWKFEGLIGLYDPPKKNIASVFNTFYKAGIKIKMITGDYPETAINIANQVGMKNNLEYLTGEEVIKMGKDELQNKVNTINIYARMFPEAKLKIIEALKTNGEIVAMTGDGVNDAPALKASHIGIAMGMNGNEIARQSANLILTDDNLEKVAEAIQQGRKIYSNLKKAIRYIISIHIPIILTAALPLIFGWKYPNIFTPIHIIFLELIMGPTCSIFFEREPVEKNIMLLNPRGKMLSLFSNQELVISITQGIIISVGVLLLYYWYMKNGYSLLETRTVVFTSLVISNIFLTFTNRSFTQNLIKTYNFKNNLAIPVIIISVLFLAIIYFVKPIRNIFEMTSISNFSFIISLVVAFVSVLWFELYKTIFK